MSKEFILIELGRLYLFIFKIWNQTVCKFRKKQISILPFKEVKSYLTL